MANPDSSPSQYLFKLQKDLGDSVPHALRRWDKEAIHDTRVNTRRLKAAIDCFKPLLPTDMRKPLSKSLRRLRRRFGPLRDLDVMLEHLRELSDGGEHTQASQWLKERLDDDRRAARGDIRSEKARLQQWSSRQHGRKLWVKVKHARDQAAVLAAGAAMEQFAEFVNQANRLVALHGESQSTALKPGTGAASEMGPDGSAGASDDPHAVRKSGKQVRYSLEIADQCGLSVPEECTEILKVMQDLLGLWHDWAVLTDQVLCQAAKAGLAVSNPNLFGQVLDLARDTWVRARLNLDQFVDVWLKQGPSLARAIPSALGREPVEGTSDPTPRRRARRRRRSGRGATRRSRLMNGQPHPAGST